MRILLPEEPCAGREKLSQYRERGGYRALEKALQTDPRELVRGVVESGLRGRGGAAFPAGKKWELVCAASQGRRYVVVNGGEDEPGSFKDRYLMEHHPHLVLEGALIAARAVAAQHIFLYINQTFSRSQASLREALAELGESPWGGGDVRVELREGPPAYVAGEDTAMLEVLEGNKPVPRKKPPYPTEAGYRGFPTLAHNVETVANLPFIFREGVESYRRLGTPQCPGTMLFYLNEEYRRPGVYELPFGTPLRHLVEELGGGLRDGKAIKAILPGGPSTAFLPAHHLDVPLDPESLKEAGSLLGCGNVRLIAEDRCMVEVSLEIAQFFARESCGKCPPCQMETNAFVTILRKILAGEGQPAFLQQVENIANFSRGKGDCSLIHMAAAPVLSAVRHFRSDFEAHLQGQPCLGAGS